MRDCFGLILLIKQNDPRKLGPMRTEMDAIGVFPLKGFANVFKPGS